MNRRRLLVPVSLTVLLGLCGAIKSVQPASAGVLDPLLACHSVPDPQARLACFERESTALAAAVSPGGCAIVPVQGKPAEEFGLAPGVVVEREARSGTLPAPPDHINARVTALTPQRDGRLVFTLDNGQVWRQLVNEGELLANVGDSVRISRGMLGAYFISLPSRRSCKVERVR